MTTRASEENVTGEDIEDCSNESFDVFFGVAERAEAERSYHD